MESLNGWDIGGVALTQQEKIKQNHFHGEDIWAWLYTKELNGEKWGIFLKYRIQCNCNSSTNEMVVLLGFGYKSTVCNVQATIDWISKCMSSGKKHDHYDKCQKYEKKLSCNETKSTYLFYWFWINLPQKFTFSSSKFSKRVLSTDSRYVYKSWEISVTFPKSAVICYFDKHTTLSEKPLLD